MKLLQTLVVALVLWFANDKLVDCYKPCSKNQYTIVENGKETCLICNDCPVGHGLVPPCGSKLKHPPKIECVACIQGKTYSDEHGPSSCKNCHLCSAHEIVTSACTINDNTICSYTCEKGYYYENSTHDCQECQDCCHDDKDIIRVEECRRHGMPSNKQCSIHDAKKCKRDFSTTSTASPVSTTETTIKSTTGVTTKPNIGMIVGFSVMGFFIAILVLVLIFCFRKAKTPKQSQNVNISYDHAIDMANVEDGAANRLLKDDDDDNDICSIKHKSFEAINKSNSISEGQTILLSLVICDNLNEDDRRKCDCSFEWKKDGDSILKNNYQNCNKDLTIQNADVADSGRYYCEVQCGNHPGHKLKSKEVVLRVNPGEGKELRLFDELDWKMKKNIANHLMTGSKVTGNWFSLGMEFGMVETDLKALENDQAESVLEYIKSACPELTVFEFWEIMKKDTMKQNRIAKLLRNDLTKPKLTQTTKAGDVANRPDSGICEDTDAPLQVQLPPLSIDDGQASKPLKNPMLSPALLNPSFVDSSREPSRESSYEDLVHGPFKNKVKNSKSVEEEGSKPKKSRFPLRKPSRESLKSFDISDDIKDVQDDETSDVKKTWKKPKYSKQRSKDSDGGVENEEYGRERKRSRSSSITSSIKDAAYAVLKQPSSDYSPLDHHHEESDEGV